MKKIIINGAKGKMGSLATETLRAQKHFEVVAEIGSKDNLAEIMAKTKPDIVLDLTRADVVYENTLTIINGNAHPVVGTSGLTSQQVAFLTGLCSEKKLGGIIVPNFSIAAVLMMAFAAKASRFLSEVEIIEAHHQQKLDSPSGTAIKTAEMIAEQRTKEKNKLTCKEIIPHARGGELSGIAIHSLRLPGVLAEQQVIFGSTGETLNITHRSIDRGCFMPGVVLACEQVSMLDSLHYGLEHLLDL